MLGLLPREPVDEVLQIPPSLLTCGGCQQNIGDRYFLKAIDQYWHEDCLSCDLCGCRLGEVGRRLYYKLGRKLCRRDYLRYLPCTFWGTAQCGYIAPGAAQGGHAVEAEPQLSLQSGKVEGSSSAKVMVSET
jgi:hypothetical protein